MITMLPAWQQILLGGDHKSNPRTLSSVSLLSPQWYLASPGVWKADELQRGTFITIKREVSSFQGVQQPNKTSQLKKKTANCPKKAKQLPGWWEQTVSWLNTLTYLKEKKTNFFFLPIGIAGKLRRPRKRILEAIAKGVIHIAWGTQGKTRVDILPTYFQAR